MMQFPTRYLDLHPDETLNYALNRWLPYWEENDVRELASGISGYEDWVPAMRAAAGKAQEEGRQQAAAFFYRATEFFMSWADPERHGLYHAYLDLFYEANAGVPHTQHEIPYDGGVLPVLTLDAEGASRGTLLIHGGFDSSMEEFFHMADAIRRDGYNVVLFEGPGQGGAIAHHGITMPHDWERPVAMVLDHFGISECALMGISLGGYLSLRAAAHEPRIKQVIQCDVMEDFRECMLARLPEKTQNLVNRLCDWNAAFAVNALFGLAVRKEPFTRWALEHAFKVSGTHSAYGLLEWMEDFNTRGFSARITQPVLTMAGTHDHLVPFSQIHRQIDTLTNAQSVTARIFTRREEAQNHCQVGNLNSLLAELKSWMAAHVSAPQAGADAGWA
jgi:pimeloyl-ACP methyl ester carboxylesterase